MFVVVLVALAMLFLGATFLGGLLREHPVVFIIYWVACGWFAFTSILLALYDLLALRIEERDSRRRLHSEIFGGGDKDDS